MTNAFQSEPETTPRRAPRARPSAGAPKLRSPEVTYTLKVISRQGEGAAAEGMRTVLFQRISEGESIEISAETDAPNLLAKLPEFVEAALEIQRALGAAPHHEGARPPGGSPVLAEESRRLRFLTGDHDALRTRRDIESSPPATPEDEPKKRGLLRLIGTSYRAICDEASLTMAKNPQGSLE